MDKEMLKNSFENIRKRDHGLTINTRSPSNDYRKSHLSPTSIAASRSHLGSLGSRSSEPYPNHRIEDLSCSSETGDDLSIVSVEDEEEQEEKLVFPPIKGAIKIHPWRPSSPTDSQLRQQRSPQSILRAKLRSQFLVESGMEKL
jgi:hypothetical protein